MPTDTLDSSKKKNAKFQSKKKHISFTWRRPRRRRRICVRSLVSFCYPQELSTQFLAALRDTLLSQGKSAFQLKAIRMLLITFGPKYVGLAFFSFKIFLNNCRYNIACFKSVVRQQELQSRFRLFCHLFVQSHHVIFIQLFLLVHFLLQFSQNESVKYSVLIIDFNRSFPPFSNE